jgi:hypothetical protein
MLYSFEFNQLALKNKFKNFRIPVSNSCRTPISKYINIELMLILSSQMILFQHPFERGDTQLHAEKIDLRKPS